MFVRVATAWVLVTTLMLCPFACLAKTVATFPGTVTSHSQRDQCTCCCPTGSRTSDDGSGHRVPSGKGGSCLCHGAVLDAGSSDPQVVAVPVFWADSAVPRLTARSLSLADSVANGHACHFPNADSGREMRALIESFLL
jgi:hypothetical protein